ncbi:UTRA domain-containing protein [Streptomyces nigra]|uniref:UTRA domain-containing protein n=1 Tax=Streptomyces nigra TaxID=1827580 RepID=UPI00368EA8CC
MEAEGLVTSSRGHGTVVRQRVPLKRLGIARYDKAKWRDGDEVAFIADRVASGRGYRRNEQTQTVSLIEAPPVVAAAHGLPEGAEVYARARLVDPTPGPAGRGGGFRVLYDAGYEIDHMKEELFARAPRPEEVKLLQLPPGEPVVELHRTTYTASGTVVEFAIGVHAASRFAWEYDFKVPDSAKDKKGQ